jgi:hypothetical protein
MEGMISEGLRVLWKIMNDVELTFHRVALLSGEHIEPQIDYPFLYHVHNLTHLPLEMCLFVSRNVFNIH